MYTDLDADEDELEEQRMFSVEDKITIDFYDADFVKEVKGQGNYHRGCFSHRPHVNQSLLRCCFPLDVCPGQTKVKCGISNRAPAKRSPKLPQ